MNKKNTKDKEVMKYILSLLYFVTISQTKLIVV